MIPKQCKNCNERLYNECDGCEEKKCETCSEIECDGCPNRKDLKPGRNKKHDFTRIVG